MSDYVMLPGARLEIGPGGKPYETLGAVPVAPCCSACAKGGRRCGALGSDSAVFDLVTNPLVLVAGGLFVWWKFFGGDKVLRRNPVSSWSGVEVGGMIPYSYSPRAPKKRGRQRGKRKLRRPRGTS
jgi:hypothetical protein